MSRTFAGVSGCAGVSCIPFGSTITTGDARPYRYKFNPACNPSGSAVVHLPSQGA
jgi:hypothetical protein